MISVSPPRESSSRDQTPLDLLASLWVAGFTLSRRADGRLGVSPPGKLTEDQQAAVKANRDALLDLVIRLEPTAAGEREADGIDEAVRLVERWRAGYAAWQVKPSLAWRTMRDLMREGEVDEPTD